MFLVSFSPHGMSLKTYAWTIVSQQIGKSYTYLKRPNSRLTLNLVYSADFFSLRTIFKMRAASVPVEMPDDRTI